MVRDLEEILSLFYEAEQNISISCFWDGGWDVKIGDNINGFEDERSFRALLEVRDYLYSYYENNIEKK